MIGVVRKLLADKRFGFIGVLGGEKSPREREYFFHQSDFRDDWEKLAKDFSAARGIARIEVEFDEVQTTKGPRAENVRRLGIDGKNI